MRTIILMAFSKNLCIVWCMYILERCLFIALFLSLLTFGYWVRAAEKLPFQWCWTAHKLPVRWYWIAHKLLVRWYWIAHKLSVRWYWMAFVYPLYSFSLYLKKLHLFLKTAQLKKILVDSWTLACCRSIKKIEEFVFIFPCLDEW